MFTANIQDQKNRQAELIREADKYRLIQSLQGRKSPVGSLAKIIQSLTAFLLLP